MGKLLLAHAPLYSNYVALREVGILKGYWRYFIKKLIWFLITFFVAIILNFILPRLMPGDPVAVITARVAEGATDATQAQKIYEYYAEEFGLNKSMVDQFFTFITNIFNRNFGKSFSQYPREVYDIINISIPWTLSLQFPAIITGWLIGNILGSIAAYTRKVFDKAIMPLSLFVSGIPPFGLAIILLSVFSITLRLFPASGGYGPTVLPHFSWTFIKSVIEHYQLPFWSIVLVAIGVQSIGMRSMSIYELNADYVKYSRFLGIKDWKIVGYVFRNAMLPQVTGLALQIGTMVGGALVAEIIFSYPGLGTAMLNGVRQGDYPLISGVTMIITIMVLLATFVLDIVYAFIDPRVKAALFD